MTTTAPSSSAPTDRSGDTVAPGATPAVDRQAGRQPRSPRPQVVLQVVRREVRSEHLVRIVAGGPGFADFTPNGFTDAYVKLLFVDPALGLTPPYDLAHLRETLPPEQRPVTRTYTVRRVDTERGELTLDFVVHGDAGLAAPWARTAEPGDLLVLNGPGGAYRPDPRADHHLFLGDESALPAICAALEALPAGAPCTALLETAEAEPTLDLPAPAGLHLVWLHRPTPGSTPELLAAALTARHWPTGRLDVFAHGERESMKAVRRVLRERMSERDTLSISGYWAHGRTEDRFQAEKREPVGQLG